MTQPPSGGCVLKPVLDESSIVEISQPPSGGCVLKPKEAQAFGLIEGPAAFGRLCVETHTTLLVLRICSASRLRAAVC